MSAAVGLSGVFDREICVGGVVGVGNVGIKEEIKGIVKVSVSVSLADIVLVTG